MALMESVNAEKVRHMANVGALIVNKTCHSLLSFAMATTLAVAAADQGIAGHEVLGIRFNCSNRFVMGAYKSDEIVQESATVLKNAGIDLSGTNCIALIEPNELGSQAHDEIELGEVASISITRYTGQYAEFHKRNFCISNCLVTINGILAYKLPGAPGPFGDELHYYLVPMSNGDILELSAPRHYLSRDNPELTRYDKDIEAIISSIEEIGQKRTKPQQRDGD